MQSGLRDVDIQTPIGLKGNKVVVIPMAIAVSASLKRLTGSPVDYQDIVAEALLGVAKARANFSKGKFSRFSTYAYIRIRGSVKDIIRREAAKQSCVVVTDPAHFQDLKALPTIEQKIARRQLVLAIWRVVSKEVPDELAHFIVMHYFADIPLERTAQILQYKSVGEARQVRKAALATLRSALAKKGITYDMVW